MRRLARPGTAIKIRLPANLPYGLGANSGFYHFSIANALFLCANRGDVLGGQALKSKEDRPAHLRLRVAIFVFCALAFPSPAGAVGDGKIRVAAFDFELFDTSLEGEVRGENAMEQRRLAAISYQFRELLAASARYDVVDLAPVRREIEAAGMFRGCNGCDVKIARSLGAEVAMTGVVQKVSNLILNINIYVRDARSGDLLQVMSADIRGNTDESWARGVSWLVRNRLLKN